MGTRCGSCHCLVGWGFLRSADLRNIGLIALILEQHRIELYNFSALILDIYMAQMVGLMFV